MNRLHQRLRDDGYAWEEADDIVANLAEAQLDDERDRQVMEYFQMLEHARDLENFDGRAKC